jgi:hypothetical protein
MVLRSNKFITYKWNTPLTSISQFCQKLCLIQRLLTGFLLNVRLYVRNKEAAGHSACSVMCSSSSSSSSLSVDMEAELFDR